jgi:hypothetical protein
MKVPVLAWAAARSCMHDHRSECGTGIVVHSHKHLDPQVLDTRSRREQHVGVPAHPATPTKADLVAERTAAIVRCYVAGDKFASIGRTVGLTGSRVRQIVASSGVPMPYDFRCAVQGCQTAPRSPNSYCSRHQNRFERFGDPLWTRSPTNAEHGTMVRYKRERCRCERCRRCNADRATEYLHRVDPEMGYHNRHRDSGGMRGRRSVSFFKERTAIIIRHYAAGATLAQIGTTVGLTRERIRQILLSSGATMTREYKCAVEDCETAPRSLNGYCYAHQRVSRRYQ